MVKDITPIMPNQENFPKAKVDNIPKGDGSFKDMLSGFIKEVNDLQLGADESIKKLATGEVKDVHQVMLAMSEADVSFKLMMEMRKKLMEAYKEVMKTQV